MKIRITEQQCRNLLEARMEGFRLDVLMSASSFSERVRYCTEMLGRPIGNGSSRVVFQVDDDCVIKLAKNPKGIAQNLEELRVFGENYLSSTPKLFNGSDDENGLWIITEYVLPAKASDFKKVLGITFKEISEFAYCVDGSFKSNGRKYSIKMSELYEKYKDNDDVVDLLNNIHELEGTMDSSASDLTRLVNWGMCMRNGKPTFVFLDCGLNQEIFNKYYRRF